MKSVLYIRLTITVIVVLLAAVLAYVLWNHYMYSAWTRDGRVRADVVRVAPDVSGRVTAVDVVDNQAVRKGEVLFVIDRDRYLDAEQQAQAKLAVAQAAVSVADASLDAAKAQVVQSKADYIMYADQSRRRQHLHGAISAETIADAVAKADAARATWSRARAGEEEASAAAQQAQACVEQARAALATARLNLQRTEVRAPIDGYVTNLLIRAGDYANAGVPRLALIDSHSFWVDGYFEETKLPHVHIGDPVDITLLSGNVHLHGTVESIARGIAGAVDPTGGDLLAHIAPSFNWVRLAQRIPVHVRIDTKHMPPGTMLVAGQTATLVVHPRGRDDAAAATAR